MDKKIIQLLTKMSDIIGIINQGYNHSNYNNKKSEIWQIYQTLTAENKEELLDFINSEFSQDIEWKVLMISLLVKSTHDIRYIYQIIDIITKDNLFPYVGIELEYQIASEVFTNDYDQKTVYELRRKLHKFNVNNFEKVFNNSFDYVPFHLRNKNRIVIITDQLLTLNHAPSKIILEECYTIQKKLGLEIFLVISPIHVTYINQKIWCEYSSENYLRDLDGNYIVTYKDNNIYREKKDYDSMFIINYKDISIKGKQILFDQDNYILQNQVLKEIYEFNPKLVYNINSIAPLADMCNSFTTVVASSMSYGYPVSDAPILLCLDDKNTDEKQKHEMLTSYQQYILKYNYQFIIDEPKEIHGRTEFGIPEDDFVITIVGNRLHLEITEDFIDVLEGLLLNNVTLSILFIGIYDNFDEYFNKDIFKNRVYYIGFQQDLVSVVSIADLYLNPPRKGGGISSLIALYAGVPVITLPNCDVAGNVGDTFICNNYGDLNSLINKYINDKEFYNNRKEYGIDYSHRLSNSNAILIKMIERIEEIIHDKEKRGNTDEDKL